MDIIFLQKDFLWALLLLSIPILIHILNLKRHETIYFSRVGFLEKIHQQNKKQKHLRNLLILLCRILAISAIVIAFAQPIIPKSDSSRQAHGTVAFYIDNSMSMLNSDDNSTLLEQAKNLALQISETLPKGSDILLSTNNFIPELNMPMGVNEVTNKLANISINAQAADINAYIEKSNNNKIDQDISSLFIFSDMQKNSLDVELIKNENELQLNFVPISANNVSNLSIDTCWFDTPYRLKNETEELNIRIRNFGKEAYHQIPLRLYINGGLKFTKSVDILANESSIIKLEYKNLNELQHEIKVELDDYPIGFDNSYYLSYNTNEQIKTLLIGSDKEEGSKWLQALFKIDPNIECVFMDINRLKLSDIESFECVFLLDAKTINNGLMNSLTRFVEQGGSLAIFPTREGKDHINKLLSTWQACKLGDLKEQFLEFSWINTQNHLFKNAFSGNQQQVKYPYTKESLDINIINLRNTNELIKNADNSLALVESNIEYGRVYLFSFPLNKELSNFHLHKLFVPTIHNIAMHSQTVQTYSYIIGQLKTLAANDNIFMNARLESPKLDNSYQLELSPGGKVLLPPSSFFEEAGFYKLINEKGEWQSLAFNYNRSESEMTFYNDVQLDSLLQHAQKNAKVLQFDSKQIGVSNIVDVRDKELWSYFLLTAICLLLVEMSICLFWKP